MAKLNSNMADKLKNMARKLQEDDTATGVKGVANKIAQQTKSQSHIKQVSSDAKLSGRKD